MDVFALVRHAGGDACIDCCAAVDSRRQSQASAALNACAVAELALLVSCLHLQRGGHLSYNWLQVHTQWLTFAAKQSRDTIDMFPPHTLRAAFTRLVAMQLLAYTVPSASSGGLVERQTVAVCLVVRREELKVWLREAKDVPEWLTSWALKESME